MICLGIALLAGIGLRAAEPLQGLDLAFDRMYRIDFAAAQEVISKHIAANPADPVGYSTRSAAFLFSELHRLGILEGEFFNSDKRILEKKKLRPDPAARQGIVDSIAKARQLGANPRDARALFGMSMAAGVQTDYMALVEKRQFASLSYAREAQAYAVKLLDADPHCYDAYVTTGVSEYLLGSMPFFVRWVVRFDKTEGSKSAAVRNLELAASKGRYFAPFANVLLAIIHVREKRPAIARQLLRQLAERYPENPLFEKEWKKLM